MSTDAASRKRIEPTRFEELSSFTLAGISAVTTNEAELSGKGKIGSLFERFHSQNMGEQLAIHLQKPGHYSCYFNYEEDHNGQYEVMVGVHVREVLQDQAVESVITFTVPAAKYAVFVTERGPIIEVVQRAWADIWQWSQIPGNTRSFTGDFEYYDQNINPQDGQAEIYISIY
ncbi:MAG TPA: GyrI-like domain-containing protein [Paenibacillus sp.]|jgi:predicted transcriptional regulator YdeE